jgi:hypothetical protein
MADAMETTGGQEGTLSTWAGPYVTDMLGKAQAFSELPYQPYTGQLTSGPSALQTQAFQGIGGLTVPTALTTAGQQAQQTFGTSQQYMPQIGTVQSYMNPYLEAVLEPQRREANRQAEIARNQMQGRMAQAGAYGGSRQAIMEAEAQRNLQTLLGDITGKGYAGAFETAQKQRQADIDAGLRGLAAQTAATQALTQAGSQEGEYGLRSLQQQLAAGATQRDIEQAGLTADYNQYLREIQYPREQLEFQRNMLAGLPIAAASFYQPAPSAFQSAAGGAGTTLELLKILGQIGRQS